MIEITAHGYERTDDVVRSTYPATSGVLQMA